MSILLGYETEYSAGQTHGPIGFNNRLPLPQKGSNMVSSSGEGHLLLVAPTGSGKGRSVIIPNLLSYPGSCIVIDCKGEAAMVTADVRRQNGEVAIIDPFHVLSDNNTGSFNPLDLAENKSAEQSAVMLARVLVGEVTSRDPFWDNKAIELISGVLAHQITTDRSMEGAYNMLFNGDVNYTLAVLLDSKAVTNTFAYNMISSYLQISADVTRGGVLSTVQQYLALFGEKHVMNALGPSSFDVSALLRGDPITIYLVIPPNKLSAFGGLLRLWVSSFIHLLTERTSQPEIPTLLVLDEAANLGHMDQLVTGITLLRSFGMRLMVAFQSVGQIKQLYKDDWTTIINNCDLMAFGIRNYMMAKEIADIFGGISAKELLQLPSDKMITHEYGKGLRILRKLDYLRDPFFKQYDFRENRMYSHKAISDF